MSLMTITNPYLVTQLPDGTIITWLRVAGDPSSAACAIVCRQHDEVWLSCACCGAVGVETIDTYPVTVVAFGGGSGDTPVATRVVALDIAVGLERCRINNGGGAGIGTVLSEAAALETYLADDQLPLF